MAIMADASLRPRSMVSSGPAPSFAVENLLSLPGLTESERGELRDLAGESDAEILETNLHRFGTRLQEKGNLQAALEVYATLRTSGSSERLRSQAQASLDAIEGRGAFGARAEFLLGRMVADATDPTTIGPMLLSSVAFELTKGMALSRFVTVAEPAWWMRGSTGRLVASALGFAVEVPTFTFSSRAAHLLSTDKTHLPDLRSDLSSSALTLGLLKASGALAQVALARTLGNLPPPGLRFAAQQGTTFLGIWSAHQLEEKLGLRRAEDGATSTADILGSMFSLGIGAHLGRKVLGPGFERFEQELKLASANSEIIENEGLGLRPSFALPSFSPNTLGIEAKQQPSSWSLMGLEEEEISLSPTLETSDRTQEGLIPASQKTVFQLKNIAPDKVVLVWQSIELVMAYAELLGSLSPEFLQKLRHYPSWLPERSNEKVASHVVYPRILEVFSGYLEKLSDPDSIRSEQKWGELEREFLLYCFASGNRGPGTSPDPWGVRKFKRILIRRRVQARLGAVSKFERNLMDWESLYFAHPKELYSLLLRLNPEFDPFQPVSYENLTQNQQNLFNWDRIADTVRSLLEELRAVRARCLAWNEVEALQPIMRMPMTIPERLRQLRVLGMWLETSKMPNIRRAEKRPVVWNPFSDEGRDSLVLHRHHGEGTLLEESDGMALVRFPDAKYPVRLLSRALVRPHEREAYREVLAGRMGDAEDLPYVYAHLIMPYYLSTREQQASFEFKVGGSDTAVAQRAYLRKMLDVVGLHSWRNDIVNLPLQEKLWELYENTGVDPVDFSLKLLIGERPSDFVTNSQAKKRKKTTDEARNRNLTPDLVREFLYIKPWREIWGPLGRPYPPHTRALGHYYPTYYRASDPRPHDLTELYFAFREGDPEAFKQFVSLLENPVEEWMSQGEDSDNSLIVPMIGAAPLQGLAESLDYPVVFPWLPRPEGYGQGVEGQRAAVKMRMVQKALRLNEEEIGKLAGKRALILDDNATDFITYMWARKLLLDAGASQVGLMALTHTQRNPKDLPFSLR